MFKINWRPQRWNQAVGRSVYKSARKKFNSEVFCTEIGVPFTQIWLSVVDEALVVLLQIVYCISNDIKYNIDMNKKYCCPKKVQ